MALCCLFGILGISSIHRNVCLEKSLNFHSFKKFQNSVSKKLYGTFLLCQSCPSPEIFVHFQKKVFSSFSPFVYHFQLFCSCFVCLLGEPPHPHSYTFIAIYWCLLQVRRQRLLCNELVF